ncbi:MAG TPA: HYR domain-containing protein, partial [Pyrinomonadaceae bacterium]|nr:HYR domain-containing protein [Pyrinomonadaceae bacterium]
GIFLIGANWNGAARYNISNNQMTGTRQGGAIQANKGSGAGDMQGTISGNTIGNPLVSLSGASQSSGIVVASRGSAGVHTAVVSNNQVHQFNEQGIDIQVGEDGGVADNADATATSGPASALNVTVTGNTVTTPGPLGLHGIHLNSGILAGDNNQVCADIGGIGAANNVQTAGNEAGGGFDIRPRQRQATRVVLPGYSGAAFDTLAVNAYLTARNNLSSVAAGSSNASGTTNDGFFGGTSCAQPAAATPPTAPSLASLGAPETDGAGRQSAAASGFSADREFISSLDKGRRLAYTERAELLRAVSVTGDFKVESPRAATSAMTALSGETVSVNVGTLRAGDSVTITFQVTVADPFAGAQPQVSNQGTVTATGVAGVPTDDPDAPGAADPTVTQLLLPPTIDVNDGAVAEPATGTANALFTVALSHPYTHAVTVNFATANGGANPATAGSDYTATSGSVSFPAGETVRTVAVPVLADGEAGEGAEHFLVNLSGAVGGTIGDGQATGTINDPSVPSAVIISELRTSGPGGAGDDFVELLNTTDSAVTVASSDGSTGWSIVTSGTDCSDTPAIVAVIPNGTVIPARGNYLLKGSAYSLGAYAAGDQTLSADIEADRNVGLFTTAELPNIGSAALLDAVGFGPNTGDNCDLLREGTNLPAAAGSTSEYSFVREVSKGQTVDTTDNAADFALVSTTPNVPVGSTTPTLGAPGPEGSANPRGPVPCSATTGAAKFARAMFDPTKGAGDAPNVIRGTTVVTNGSAGTIEFRRTFTNNAGGIVSALRFRVVGLSTGAGAADLRLLSASAAGGAEGTTLETPPAQGAGGGLNSSLAVALPPAFEQGDTISLRFVFGVEQPGDYEIGFVLESLPDPSGKDFWKLAGHTENGGHTDGGCNKPPVANAGPDQNVECSSGQASVTLDGSASTDPDGDTPLTYEWSEGGSALGTGQTLGVTLPYGPHTITLKVTDPSGDSSQDTVAVNVVDTTKPVVTPPANVTVYTGPGADSCGATVGDDVLGTASAADSCQGALPVERTGVPANNFFAVGPNIITYTATDAAGNKGTATQTVTVIDNTAPKVTAPANVSTVNDAGSCSAAVNPGTATATDNCNVQSVVGARSDNQDLDAPYPVGTTTITWTATDVNGNTAQTTQTVTVSDAEKPSLFSSVAVTLMGSPFNHAMINVGLSASATDNCPGLGPYQVSVFSDEANGAAPHSPDATDIGVGTLRLRRERDGAGDGRVYLVVVRVTDAYGNTSASCSTVGVPLSSSSAHVASVNAQANSAASYCSANGGSAPPGYFPIGQ